MSGNFVEMSAAEYHADKTRVSRSHLVDFLQSPWLYFKRYIRRDPKWQKEATDALDFGILFHAAVLEGVPITDMVHLIPESVLNDDGHRKGKPWLMWKALHDDKPCFKEADFDLPRMMESSLQNSTAAMELLEHSQGKNEQTIHWSHSGVELRTRLDRIIQDDCIIDLKTARSCDLERIEASLEYDLYYFQAAFYQMAVESVLNVQLPFRFIFVEKCIPFRTVVVEMDQQWINEGRAEVASALERLQKRADSGDWTDPTGNEIIKVKRRPNRDQFKWKVVEE